MSLCAMCGVERQDGRELCPHHTRDGEPIPLPDALEELRREAGVSAAPVTNNEGGLRDE